MADHKCVNCEQDLYVPDSILAFFIQCPNCQFFDFGLTHKPKKKSGQKGG